MTRMPTGTELRRLQARCDLSLQWRCVIESPTGFTVDSGSGSGGSGGDLGGATYPEGPDPIPEWPGTDSAEMACGFQKASPNESEGAQAPLADGTIRLPVETAIDSRQRIRLTRRPDGVVIDEEYAIVGEATRPYGLFISLRVKRVTGGSIL